MRVLLWFNLMKSYRGGTKMGKDNLIDTLGLAYGKGKSWGKSAYNTLWECTVRGKGMPYNATVKQTGTHFTRGPREHCHNPEKGNVLKTKVSLAAKKAATCNKQQVATRLVQASQRHFSGTDDCTYR